MPHLTQIAARELNSGSEFSTYVTPKLLISEGAQQTTGIRMADNNVMYVSGTIVETVNIQCAVENFIKWLKKYNIVVLVAHNGRRFDFSVLVAAVSNVNKLEEFLASVVGCLDTLPLFRKTYSDRSSYKQGDLVQDILGIQYNAHDALEDVRALVKLFQHCCALVNDMIKFTFSLNAVYHQCLSSKEKAKNLPSLSCLIASSVCKLPTAENIASSGLNLEHLRKIFIRDGEDGLHSTFTMRNSEGQPRRSGTSYAQLGIVLITPVEIGQNLSSSLTCESRTILKRRDGRLDGQKNGEGKNNMSPKDYGSRIKQPNHSMKHNMSSHIKYRHIRAK
ncbi:uncharacterized protein LOC132748252, partial [Ruditapes philippinarum]|uniref:uncharacterized protein LOC132748252 n=1 Tax=Ruditapes philippinarum TaxID=129788 RepID=UPI00295BEE7B